MGGSPAGWEAGWDLFVLFFLALVASSPEADSISLPGGKIGESSCQFPRVVDAVKPVFLSVPKVHRSADVEEDDETEVGVSFEFFDVVAVRASPGAPVEPPEVITGNIFSILSELQRRAADRAAVEAGDTSDHSLTGADRKGHEPGKNGWVEVVAQDGRKLEDGEE